jgi:hypothetical protein
MKSLCAAVCGVSCLLALAACEPTYMSPPPPDASPTAMYAPPGPVVAAAPVQRPCVYTSRSYISGSAISPPELPGTTLQCINGTWHSI